MKKLVSLTLALVLIVTCLSGLVFAADPIAKVETAGKTVEVTTVDELVAAIDKKGTSTVTLLKDVNAEATVNIPVCTFDLNGHTWSVKDAAGEYVGGLYFNVSATDEAATNLKSVLKNGTIMGKIALSCNVGGLTVDNATIVSHNGTAIQLTSGKNDDRSLPAGKWNDHNLVKNSTLVSANYTAMIYNSKDQNFSAVSFKVENTTMVTKSQCFSNAAVAASGTFELGKGVNMYTLAKSYTKTSDPMPTITGEAVTQTEGTVDKEVNGVSLAGLNQFSTPAMPAPVVPETPATPATPATPSVPATGTPDVSVPATGVSVIALGVMAMVSLAGAALTKKH